MGKYFPGHLHVHTEYSSLDGMAKIEELAKKAKELGHKFIAVTDHGSSTGLFECAEISKKHDIQIILGEEFYFEGPADLKLGHLILLAKNEEGLRNIFRLQKKANDNFYYKPRINLDMLKEHNEGLICTTACIANQIGQFILKDEIHLAVNHILELKQIFGDDLYIELQSSTVNEVIKVNKKLEELCFQYKDFNPIITNDVHYVDKEDCEVHEVVLCVQQKAKMDSPKRWKFETNDYWLKSQDEIEQDMTYIKEETFIKAYSNLDQIAKKCKVGLDLEYGNYLPKYSETEDEDQLLLDLTIDMYNTRIKDRGEANSSFMADLSKELNVIQQTGYSGYFLIVQEYINWAKETGIFVGDGRGSGAGCKVAYTIGITEVNPQKYDLLFERFLSVGREPDFDVDFSDINAVFKHLQDVYGKNNVARVGALSRFTAKSATRKIMGVYGYTQAEQSRITGLMPSRLSFTLDEAINESKELKEWFNKNTHILKVVRKIEGIVEHLSTHAGGVIICEDLESILPVFTQSDDREKMIVALDKKQLEKLGHYKFDVLGLNSLTLMENITKYTGRIEWHTIDFEDSEVYDMLCEGDVLGVFQMSEQADKVVQQQPRCFEDLISINALIRPGVCDWNEYLQCRADKVKSKLPYMNCTHGLIVYQDQYLQLAQTYAGWGIAFSDKHIRKNKDILSDVKLREKFLEDGYAMGYESSVLEDVWGKICDVVAGGYGFNRAHSTSYAMLTYQTAYMKHHYPKEFYSAYMTQNFDDSAKITEVLNLLKEQGIKVIPPDINKSTDEFVPCEEGIFFPLTAIRGVGGSVWAEIERLRPVQNLEDFLNRRTKKFIKSTSVEALIKAGAFDFEEKSRFELLEQFQEGHTEEKNYVYEKEALDYYLSDSPFDKYDTKPYNKFTNGSNVLTIVEASEVSVKNDKNGREMAFITGINKSDIIRMVVFSSVWKGNKCQTGDLIMVNGKKDNASLLVNSIELIA